MHVGCRATRGRSCRKGFDQYNGGWRQCQHCAGANLRDCDRPGHDWGSIPSARPRHGAAAKVRQTRYGTGLGKRPTLCRGWCAARCVLAPARVRRSVSPTSRCDQQQARRHTRSAGHGAVRPAPDFVIFDPRSNTLRAILECKVANDGGTARDKAARFGRLREESQRLGGVPVIAVLGGIGWRRAADALGPVIASTDGRTFTVANLDGLLEVDPFPGLRDLA